MKLKHAFLVLSLLVMGAIIAACGGTSTPQFQLNVEVEGDGTVTSDPAGINCGNDCEEEFDEDSTVELTATPGEGESFEGWSGGGCTGLLGCEVTMDAAKTVTATFTGEDGEETGGEETGGEETGGEETGGEETGGEETGGEETGGEETGGTEVTATVAASSDDAEEFRETNANVTAGQTDIANTNLDMVNDIDGTLRGQVLVGVRFENVAIPADATVTDAYIQFTADASNDGDVTFTIAGQDSGTAPTFTTTANDISGRTTTTATASWEPDAWTAGDAGDAQQTTDVSAILNEIIASGWDQANNGVVFVISGDDTDDAAQARLAESFDGNNTAAAQLVVTYTTPAP